MGLPPLSIHQSSTIRFRFDSWQYMKQQKHIRGNFATHMSPTKALTPQFCMLCWPWPCLEWSPPVKYRKVNQQVKRKRIIRNAIHKSQACLMSFAPDLPQPFIQYSLRRPWSLVPCPWSLPGSWSLSLVPGHWSLFLVPGARSKTWHKINPSGSVWVLTEGIQRYAFHVQS